MISASNFAVFFAGKPPAMSFAQIFRFLWRHFVKVGAA